jgi:hypothetical protein
MSADPIDQACKHEQDNVIEFKKPEKDPHGQGLAFCICCKHEWQAVEPSGTFDGFECPECGSFKGKFKYEFMPAVGDVHFVCNCGNALFYIMPEGHLCANCGIYAEY